MVAHCLKLSKKILHMIDINKENGEVYDEKEEVKEEMGGKILHFYKMH